MIFYNEKTMKTLLGIIFFSFCVVWLTYAADTWCFPREDGARIWNITKIPNLECLKVVEWKWHHCLGLLGINIVNHCEQDFVYGEKVISSKTEKTYLELDHIWGEVWKRWQEVLQYLWTQKEVIINYEIVSKRPTGKVARVVHTIGWEFPLILACVIWILITIWFIIRRTYKKLVHNKTE